NIIANNTNTGIYLNMNCNDTIIRNNYIGVDVTGSVAMGNGNGGIQILGYDYTNKTDQPSNRTIIGGAQTEQGNIISSNTNQGIFLNNNVNDSVIQGNKIGVDITG